MEGAHRRPDQPPQGDDNSRERERRTHDNQRGLPSAAPRQTRVVVPRTLPHCSMMPPSQHRSGSKPLCVKSQFSGAHERLRHSVLHPVRVEPSAAARDRHVRATRHYPVAMRWAVGPLVLILLVLTSCGSSNGGRSAPTSTTVATASTTTAVATTV